MILSDEDEDYYSHLFDDCVEDQPSAFVQSDDQDDKTKSAKKMWTNRSTKKNHANAGNAASSALLVDDKPWRKTSIKGRLHTTPPALHVDTPSATSTTKTPTTAAATISSSSSHNPPPSPYTEESIVKRRPLPFLKYIKLKGQKGGASNLQSPARRSSSNNNATPSNRGSAATTPKGSTAEGGVWSDGDIDDNSSVSSEMISYSSIDSVDSDDACFSMPLEDYVHHPEDNDTFWTQLPYIPQNFVYDEATMEDTDDINNNANDGGNNVPNLLDPTSPTSSPPTAQGPSASTPPLPYLDPPLRDFNFGGNLSQRPTIHFVLDHRFYLRSIIQLLAERDEVGVEDSIDDDENIIKKGPLKKKYVGVVKNKYLELRRGNLTYFGDDNKKVRTTIHLRSATATCHAVETTTTEQNENGRPNNHGESGTNSGGGFAASAHSSTAMVEASTAALSAGLTSAVHATTSAASTMIPGGTSYTPGFEFHLWVEGKRYAWLANSKTERQSWVRAINQAMIGDTINDLTYWMTMSTTNTPTNLTDEPSHEESLASYLALKSKLESCTTAKDYRNGILAAVTEERCGESPPAAPVLQVPLKMVLDQLPKDAFGHMKKDGNSQQLRLKNAIAEFWSNMGKFDFAINGHIIDRESPYAAERTIGGLVRCILDYDRAFAEVDTFAMPSVDELTPGQSARIRAAGANRRPVTNRISELEAVSYARSILLMIFKCKTSPVIEMTIENLCKNEGLVTLEPSSSLSASSETLHLDVSFAGDDVVDHADDATEISDEASGWIMVRRSKYNSWKTRFCVFSEGVFSYYENAEPRPHGLRGQLLLNDAFLTTVIDEKELNREDAGLYVLRLSTKNRDREREFGFKTEEEYMEWKEAIRHVVDTCNSAEGSSGAFGSSGRRDSGSKKARNIIEEGSKFIGYAADGGIKVIKGATGGGIKVVKGGTKVVKGAAGGGVKALKGATNLVFRSIRSKRRSAKKDSSFRALRKSPSLQFLMENERSDKTGKLEPTVQCIIQTNKDFFLRAVDGADLV